MAIGSGAIWRVRVGGNDANGAAFDPTIAGAGADYSQQDAPQAADTGSINCSNNTTVTTAGSAIWNSTHIGNAMRITGGGATAGYYFITGINSGTSVVVDRSPGSVAGGSMKLGGAAASPRMLKDSNAAGDKVVFGNTVYVRGSGSDYPTSDDYTLTGTTTWPGSVATGRVKVIGENGRPRLNVDGYAFNMGSGFMSGLFFIARNNLPGSGNGIVNIGGTGAVVNCVFNTNGQSALFGIRGSNSVVIYGCEITGGMATPTLSASCYGIQLDSYGPAVIACRVHHCRNAGILSLYHCTVTDCLVYKNAAEGIYLAANNLSHGEVARNTIDANASHGILINPNIFDCNVHSNIISNHTIAGKSGIYLTATTAENEQNRNLFDYNAFYNNTAHITGLALGANDVAGLDPQYTDAANGDYTLGQALLKQSGWPRSWLGYAQPLTYYDRGAVQLAGSSDGGLVIPVRRSGVHLRM